MRCFRLAGSSLSPPGRSLQQFTCSNSIRVKCFGCSSSGSRFMLVPPRLSCCSCAGKSPSAPTRLMHPKQRSVRKLLGSADDNHTSLVQQDTSSSCTLSGIGGRRSNSSPCTCRKVSYELLRCMYVKMFLSCASVASVKQICCSCCPCCSIQAAAEG
jgi:hypothetical protein